ncbi:MAG: hypothetical protein ACTHU0_27930 [Kofleriaceae bacterium]
MILHTEVSGACRTKFHDAPAAAASVLLVGEDNPLSAAPEHALFPYPAGCSGWRLCNKILDVSRRTYLATWRTNLCVGKWSKLAARTRSIQLLRHDVPWSTLVLLGRKVHDAFAHILPADAPRGPFSSAEATTRYMSGDQTELERTFRLVFLPHPSGRNLVWNTPGASANARALLAEVVPDYPCGEIIELTDTEHVVS